MKSILQQTALYLALLAPSVAMFGCATECVYGYYGSYCYSYGYYYDSLVSGLNYTSTGVAGEQTGMTGEDDEGGPGSFRYVEGDTVSFSLGDTVLGESDAGERLTPFDLAGFEENAVGGCDLAGALPEDDDAFRVVINLAILLQTLDADGDHTNGIDISSEVEGLFDGVELDLSQAAEAFQADTDLQTLLDQAKSQALLPETRALRDKIDALRALYEGTGLCP